MMKNAVFISLIVLGFSAAPLCALRAEDRVPGDLDGTMKFELQNDWNYQSEDPDQEVNTLGGKVEAYASLAVTERLTIDTSLIFEPVQDNDPGDDTTFGHEGLYAEELKFQYTGDVFTVFAGKFNPVFGLAWDLAPGMYGDDFSKDYELTERVGAGGSVTFEAPEYGTHTVSASIFKSDRSFLSDSFITRRGSSDLADGGVSNTDNVSSYTLTLNSVNPGGIEGLETQVGYLHQQAGDADAGFEDERGYVLGANYTMPLTDDIDAIALVEWADFSNVDGSNDDTDYMTLALAFEFYDRWQTAVAFTERDTNVDAAPDVDDRVLQLSLGYLFDNGIEAEVAYRNLDVDAINTHTLGVQVSYAFDFSLDDL